MSIGPRRAGVTLVELLVVMAIVSLMLALAFPNVTAGLEGIRLRAAAEQAGIFFAEARQRADRFQSVVQISVDPKLGRVEALAADGDWSDSIELGPGLSISYPDRRREYLLYPGAPAPELKLSLAGENGGRAGIRINALSGAPEQWDDSQ